MTNRVPRKTRSSRKARPRIHVNALVDQAATSIRTSGWRYAIFNSCFAAPDGSRRPCSHCSRVRLETPSAAANCACESPLYPIRKRMTAEREEGLGLHTVSSRDVSYAPLASANAATRQDAIARGNAPGRDNVEKTRCARIRARDCGM